MADLRTALAAVLGLALGAVMIAAPRALIRIHVVGRVPGDRGGEYGADSDYSSRVVLLVRLLGLGVVGLGAYFGAQVLSLL